MAWKKLECWHRPIIVIASGSEAILHDAYTRTTSHRHTDEYRHLTIKVNYVLLTKPDCGLLSM
jgi:hypothetical protein